MKVFRNLTHAQNDTRVDTPSIPLQCPAVANVRPCAYAYKRQVQQTSFSTHRKGPQWGRALRVRKTTNVVTMPMLCLRRKFVGHVANLHGATARALGHAGSLQRVRRALFNLARRHSEGALTRAILAEGSLGALRSRTAPQRERLGTQDPCRGFGGHFTHSHGATARALRGARSLQRVHRALHARAKRGER